MIPIKFSYGGKYKWHLDEALARRVDIPGEVDHPFYSLKNGLLVAKDGYEWDGASGPAVDTANFMRGSCLHDLLYQLMREGIIDRKKWRKRCDKIMREICLEDGMSKVRAWWVYMGVRIGANGSSKQTKGE